MLIAVRHGATDHNENGSEKLRGWLPVSLTLDGMEESRTTAELLAKTTKEVESIKSSDLVRAVQSAQEIGMALQHEVEFTDLLRDFNTGSLAGLPVNKDTISFIHTLIKAGDEPAPQGETYNTFLARIVPVLKAAVESDKVNIIVAHGRVMTLLHAITISGDPTKPDHETLLGPPPISPSGVMVIGSDWKVHHMTAKEADSARLS